MTGIVENRKTFGVTLNELGLTGIGAEIGVAYGENARYILDCWAGYGLFLIDPYDLDKCGKYVDGSANIDFNGAYNYMFNHLRLHPMRAILLRMTSNEAAPLIGDETLDFVYIDGNHHNPQFQQDLDNWYPKVKPGGIVAGHDYYDLDTLHYICEVKSTVDKFITTITYDRFYTTECSSWWLHKTA